MKIKRVKVKNFRSVREAEITPSSFNVFVGQNNHGKTNLFESLAWFFNGPRKSESLGVIRYRGAGDDDEVSVEVEFSGAQEGAQKMKNEGNRTKIQNVIGESDVITVVRSSAGEVKKRTLLIDGESKKNPAGIDNALNDFLPSFEYVSTQINPLDVTKYKANTPIANMLSGVLSAILEQDETYAEFKKKFDDLFTDPNSRVHAELDNLSGEVKLYLIKQFPDCEKVVFSVSAPIFEDLLKSFEAEIDDGVYTTASEKGDGMQRALMLAIIQAYADFRREHEETSKYFLFFIDEGELHLHPTAQRKLKNALVDLASRGDQIFLNTHSSVLVSDEMDGQTIYRVEKIDKQTSIAPIKAEEKPHVVYELLGGSPSDLLLPSNFLIVEGKSEYEFISRVISRFYSDKVPIQIIYAEGDHRRQRKSMDSINKVFVPLHSSPVYKEQLVILCDTPNETCTADFDRFKISYSYLEANGQLFVIPRQRLEEYYPAPWKKTAAECQAMNGEKEKNGKLLLAQQVGDAITQEQFESEMSVIFDSLSACWSKAYY
jgi:putative ATP-dependent endonuclease of OLD family